MAHIRIGLILAVLTLAACDTAGGLRAGANSPFAPGVSSNDVSVDGLIVGHRLMAAGEYELALRAYYRAAADHGLTVDVYSAVGSANLKLGRLGQAERDLRQAIQVDETFVPAWNNLGVVLMEQSNYGEAALVFRRAFALDSGNSDEIKENLRLALEKLDNPAYDPPNDNQASLVRRGTSDYLLLTTP